MEDKTCLQNNKAKDLIEDFTERMELETKILEFSGFSDNGNDQVQEIKN